MQGMRIEIDFEGGKNAAGIYVHKKLPEAMGNSVAAFAHAVLSGHTQPGVWYPEEKEALSVGCDGQQAVVERQMKLGFEAKPERPAWLYHVMYTKNYII